MKRALLYKRLYCKQKPNIFTSRFLSVTTSTEGTERLKNNRRYESDVFNRVKALMGPETNIQTTDSEIWEEVNLLLKKLFRQSQRTAGTMEEYVNCSIRLLDRLASSLPQRDDVLFVSMLDTEVLNTILYHWKQEQWERSRKYRKHSNKRQRVVHPMEMAEKIDKYRWSSLVQPDSKTFAFLLDAASSLDTSPSRKDGIHLAEELLHKLIHVSKDNPLNVLVDTTSFSIIMRARVRKHRRPDKAHEWLRTMQELYQTHGWEQVRTNAVVYTTIIHGWAQAGNAVQAQKILQEQFHDFSNNNNMDCRPDTRTFNAVLNAWQHSKDKEAVQHCKDILKQMKELSTAISTTDPDSSWDCVPDEYSFASYIICCANHLGPEKALETMATESIPPSLILYNAILRAYAQNGKGEKAEELLKEMSLQEDLFPDEITLNTVLSAWSKSKNREAPHRAEHLLWNMQHEYGVNPSVVSFGSVLQAWAKASQTNPSGAHRAEMLLRQMKSVGVEPNLICYNTVMNAWATVARQFRDQDAVSRATQLLHELLQESSKVIPTEMTFRTMLHLIAGSAIPNKAERTQAILLLMERNGIQPSVRDGKLIKRLLKSKTKTKETSRSTS